jgi:hypothetical protein
MNTEYAFKNGVRYWINNPLVQTGQRYTWIDDGIEYEVYPAKGEKNKNHFRVMPGVKIDEERIFHKHCQYYIQDSKGLWINDYCNVQATKVLIEHEAAKFIKKLIPNYNMIPDCLFLDAKDNILCIVEVNVTHPKSKDDIKKIQQYKIITYELTYGKTRTDYINPIRFDCLYESEENNECNALRSKIEKQKDRIRKANYYLQQQQEEIRSIEQLVIDKLILNYEQTKQTETA